MLSDVLFQLMEHRAEYLLQQQLQVRLLRSRQVLLISNAVFAARPGAGRFSWWRQACKNRQTDLKPQPQAHCSKQE